MDDWNDRGCCGGWHDVGTSDRNGTVCDCRIPVHAYLIRRCLYCIDGDDSFHFPKIFRFVYKLRVQSRKCCCRKSRGRNWSFEVFVTDKSRIHFPGFIRVFGLYVIRLFGADYGSLIVVDGLDGWIRRPLLLYLSIFLYFWCSWCRKFTENDR